MEKVSIHSDYITLQALLKLTGYIGSGGEVKHFLSTEQVLVNEEREIRRGRKLYSDDIIKIGKQGCIQIIKEEAG